MSAGERPENLPLEKQKGHPEVRVAPRRSSSPNPFAADFTRRLVTKQEFLLNLPLAFSNQTVMAIFLPLLHSKNLRLTPGERRFGICLMRKLEDDYHIWINVPVGPKQLRPDFVVLHPGRGILVLEVKDWKLPSICQMDRFSAQLLTDRGLTTVANPLEQARIDRVRWHLFPEIRIQQGSLFDTTTADAPDAAQSIAKLLPDVVKIMDLEQEKVARNLGEGHRIIHGVAGSGKTLLLAYRCLHLNRQGLAKPILVLCYNKTLAAKLKEMLAQKGAGDRVHVRHFHGWCTDMCRLYQLDLPKDARPVYERQVEAVIAATEKGRSTILKVNYRNTVEALDFSYQFLSAYMDAAGGTDEIPVVHPEFGGRNGAAPEIHRLSSLRIARSQQTPSGYSPCIPVKDSNSTVSPSPTWAVCPTPRCPPTKRRDCSMLPSRVRQNGYW